MKKYITIIIFIFLAKVSAAQQTDEGITKACLNYIEGFYEGDTTKLIQSLQPSLHKYGFYKDKNSGNYAPDGYMTYRDALNYAKGVLEKKRFAKPDAPKKVEILDIQHAIASAKVTAWWGVDYILLSRQNNKWMIEQVLWEGPLQK